MTLKPRVSNEMEFIQILKSKHARYIDGTRVVDVTRVAKDYIPPGTAMGKIDNSIKCGPVTRDEVAIGGVNTTTNTIPLKNLHETQWHNWQVGDEVICDPGENNEETAVVQTVEEEAGELVVDGISNTHGEGVIVQKNDGTSRADFICLSLVELNGEDALIGGITHGAVYAAYMANFDAVVAEDLPQISFE